MVAAAVIGVVGAAGAAATAYAGSEAASATTDAANTAAAVQNNALTQEKAQAAPYTALGTSALPQYEALLGIGPNANSATTLAALQATPGYQFTQQQGEQGILNAGSAAGGLSGNTLTALDQYNTGLADNTYQNAVGNAQGAVGLGQAAAAGTASNIGTTAGNLSNIAVNQGNNIANIDTAGAAALSKIVSGAGNQYTTLQYLNNQTNPGTSNSYGAGTPAAGTSIGGYLNS